jgi:DNA repair protein RadC
LVVVITPRVRDLPVKERPVIRLRAVGPEAVSTTELLACLLQTPDALYQAQQLLVQINGIGPAKAARIKAWFTTTRLAIPRLRRRT